MSRHNFPRHDAVMEILRRTDISQVEKHKRIEKLNKSFKKFYEKKNEKARGVRLAAKPAVSKTVTEGSSPSRPAIL